MPGTQSYRTGLSREVMDGLAGCPGTPNRNIQEISTGSTNAACKTPTAQFSYAAARQQRVASVISLRHTAMRLVL